MRQAAASEHASAFPKQAGPAPSAGGWRVGARCALAASLLCLAACATREAPAPVTPEAHTTGTVLGRNERVLIYQNRQDETLGDIAHRWLGATDQAWQLRQHNPGVPDKVPAGTLLAVPLQPPNPTGISRTQVQTVPILCYHRFGSGTALRGATGKMTVSANDFAAQLDWLARHDWHVLRLGDLTDWLEGRRAVPPRSVVITADDGYESFYKLAYPLLKRHGFPATLFTYTDFIGAGDAVDWAQIKEMTDSGLIDVQAHSRTHRNLLDRPAGETDERYRQIIDEETRGPRELLLRRLGTPQRHYAYPYGDANQQVLDALKRQGVELGMTVTPGGNPFYAHPLMLRRTMIYGDMDLDDFKARLQASRPWGER
ncbi:MAG: polysaccharide deacetylase family protein [Aquabacterium sp.]